MWICIAPYRDHISKALRYGTRSQGTSQFYLRTPRSSANGMNHTCQGFIYTPLGGYTPPCDMSTHPLGRTPRGHKVVSTSA